MFAPPSRTGCPPVYCVVSAGGGARRLRLSLACLLVCVCVRVCVCDWAYILIPARVPFLAWVVSCGEFGPQLIYLCVYVQ